VWVGIIGVWCFRVPFAYILAFPAGLGLYGIWITMILDWLARAVVYAFIWRRGKWKDIRL
jgi:Na+-driven multidrug efflux pump